MAAKLWSASINNAFSTTLDGSITDSDSTITLTSVTGLQAPGVLVIDRVDSAGTSTPGLREYISFTGISTKTLTGVSRALGGSVAQEHASSAVIEETLSITHWNDLVSFANVSHDASGNIVVSSTATISTARVDTHLNVAGASVTGNFPIHPTWYFQGSASTPTSLLGKPASMPQGGSWSFFSATLNGPASGATIVLDINKNFNSIYDAATRLMIPAGGTYASTASINTKIFVGGDIFSVDMDQIGDANIVATVTGRG